MPNALITQFLVSLNKLTNFCSLHEKALNLFDPPCATVQRFIIENSTGKRVTVLFCYSCHASGFSIVFTEIHGPKTGKTVHRGKNIVALINHFFSKLRPTMKKKVKIALSKDQKNPKQTKTVTFCPKKKRSIASKFNALVKPACEGTRREIN